MNFIIHVNLGAATLRDFADTCSEAGTSFEGKIFDDIFRDFLEETGAPCPQLLESIKDRLSPQINLDEITSSTFRMKILCWSVSGAPRVMHEGQPLRVCFAFITINIIFSLLYQ